MALVAGVLVYASDSSRASNDPAFAAAPGEASTGVPDGIGLTPSGSIKANVPGTIIDAVEVTGSIHVLADNVTITNSRINAEGTFYGIKIASGVRGLTVADSEIYGARSAAISYGEYDATRLDIHSSRDGFLAGSNVTIRDSWVHDLQSNGVGIRTIGGVGSTIWGNHIALADGSSGAAIELRADRKNLEHWLVQGNYLDGGRNTLKFDARRHDAVNVQFADNLWMADSWGQSATYVRASPSIWSNNRHSDGTEIASPRPVDDNVVVTLVPPGQTSTSLSTPTTDNPSTTTTESSSSSVVETTVPESTVTSTQPTSTSGPEPTDPSPTTESPTTTTSPTSTAPTTAPTTAPPPVAPGSWETAVGSNNIETIKSWYKANTGFTAFHSPTLGRKLTADDLEPMRGLAVTEDNTVIEGKYITGSIRIQAKNVTIRGSIIDVNGSYSYGVQATDSKAQNWKVEYVTFKNSRFDSSQHHDDRGNRAVFASQPGQARFTQTMNGYGAGLRSESSNNQLWEYNYVDRIVTSPGSHNTSLSLRSNKGGRAVQDIVFRRNLVVDGTSSAMSFYPRSAEVHRNLLFEENIFDIYYSNDRTVNYCVNRGSAEHGGVVYKWDNVRWRGNIFGQSQTSKCGTSNFASGKSGNEWSRNRYLDGTPIS